MWTHSSLGIGTLALVSVAWMAACDEDIAAPLDGDYVGDIVTDTVVETNYTVSVTADGTTTVSIDGADFMSFDVDLVQVGGTTTSLPGDTVNQLTWTDGRLSVNHIGSQSVQFTGVQVGVEADADTDADADADADADTDSDADTDVDVSAAAAGTFTGEIAGPVVDLDYTLTLEADGPDTVTASGPGITSFDVPLAYDGTDIEASGVWTEGTFSLSGDMLDIVHTTQGMTFSGTRD